MVMPYQEERAAIKRVHAEILEKELQDQGQFRIRLGEGIKALCNWKRTGGFLREAA